jgi:hypothetical protein
MAAGEAPIQQAVKWIEERLSISRLSTPSSSPAI